MTSWIALTRPVPSSINDCELSHLAREPIDVMLAASQHSAYERALARAGCVMHRVGADDAHPDSVFIEDTAAIFDEVAVLTRPGAASRRAEIEGVAERLATWRTLVRIQPPATLDGGDVLVIGRAVHVGASARTNRAGIEQLAGLLMPHGYSVRPVPVERCLHLKSAVTQVADRTVLLNPGWVDASHFNDFEIVQVDAGEPDAANALRIGETVLYGAHHPRTRARLEEAGVVTCVVDLSELAKAEGAVTCCSLIIHGK